MSATAALGVACGLLVSVSMLLFHRIRSPTGVTALAVWPAGALVASVGAVTIGTVQLHPLGPAILGAGVGAVGIWTLVTAVVGFGVGPLTIGVLSLAFVGGSVVAVWMTGQPVTITVFLTGGLLAGITVAAVGIFGRVAADLDEQTGSDPVVLFVEVIGVAIVAIGVPAGARAIALFPIGGPLEFGLGLLAVPTVVLGGRRLRRNIDGQRLDRLRSRIVEGALGLYADVREIVSSVADGGTEPHTEAAETIEEADEIVAAAPTTVPAATHFLEDAQAGLAADNRGLAVAAAEIAAEIAAGTVETETYLDRAGRLLEALEIDPASIEAASVDLSDARAAHEAGDDDRARAIAEGAVLAAIAEAGDRFELVVQNVESARESRGTGAIVGVLARLDAALAASTARSLDSAIDRDEAIQRLQELLSEFEEDPDWEFETVPAAAVRAASATAWRAVRQGDTALRSEKTDGDDTAGVRTEALVAAAESYTIAIDAYLTALRAALEAETETDAKRIGDAFSVLTPETTTVLLALTMEEYTGPSIADRTGSARTRSVVRRGLSTIKTVRVRTGIDAGNTDAVRSFLRYGALNRRLQVLEPEIDRAEQLVGTDDSAAREAYRSIAERFEELSDRAANAGRTGLSSQLASKALACRENAAAIGKGEYAAAEAVNVSISPPAVSAETELRPAGDRIRGELLGDRFLELRRLLRMAAEHPIRRRYDEPVAGKIESMATVLDRIDPIVGTSNLDGMCSVGMEVTRSGIESALDGAGVVESDPIGDLEAADSIEAFTTQWLKAAGAIDAATAADRSTREDRDVDAES